MAVSLCYMASAQSVFRLQYWFDDQFANGITDTSHNGRWQTPIEASQLSDGFHTFYLQVQDSSGQWFSPRSYLFYRLPDTVTEQQVHYTCWFDDDYLHTQSDSISVGNLLLETGMLATGFHTVHFQFNFSNSVSFKSFLFYKTPSPSTTDSMAYTFWFDQDYSHRHTGYFISEHLVFDIDSLPTGFHTINAQFSCNDNVTLKSFLFYKKPHDEIKIVQYEYWVNDLDSLSQSVAITPRDTFNLAALLTVPTQPIRSTYFHFNPNGGIPIVNAKNDIHFKFYNAEGRFALKVIPYIDITVVDTIFADTLERNTTKVVPATNGNDIYWFNLGAGVGDSLAFHTNKPCTMQLFAPSGEEVFSCTGTSVLTWHGCHAWESGDYYLAVHDVVDTGTIAVSYQWIYRYAVLAWDVHRVGNGGLSTITFEGNGFNSLDTVYLIKGIDTLPALYIGRESNTTTAAIFNFENADTGMYHAVFMYVDENLNKTNVVFIEEAMPIVLTTTCSYPETFLRGSTVTYTYTITNTGNMTAYALPMHAFIRSSDIAGITNIELKGLELPSLIAGINLDTFPEPIKTEIIELSKKQGHDLYFERDFEIDSMTGDTALIYANYFYCNLAPYEIRTIQVVVTANDSVEVQLVIPTSMSPMNLSWQIPMQLMLKDASTSNWYCCTIEILECYLNMKSIEASTASLTTAILSALSAASIIGAEATPELALASKAASIAACVTDAMTASLNHFKNVFCSNESVTAQKIAQAYKMALKANLSVNTILDCASAILPAKLFGNFFKVISSTGDFANIALNLRSAVVGIPGADLLNCGIKVLQRSPNCPPGPTKGGTSTPQVPVDPNDIIGYIAESGSHYIGEEQIQMPYIIEFENDTAFATAHAHTVVVKDTLNGNVFDLNSFSATAFAIGENVTTINGGQSFTRTVDMRPAIDVLAQVQLDYQIDSTFAVATWTFLSLDPITLQPTTDPTLGFLPANFNGDGTGEVSFTINRKAYLPDSTVIDNRALIKFDNEEPIATSTWRNIVDNTPPMSTIDSIIFENSTMTVAMSATDNLSGVWRYNVYGQVADSVWIPLAMRVSIDTMAVLEADTSHYLAFRTTAIDSAGNVEPLKIAPPVITIYDTVVITACDSYTWFDSTYSASGAYSRLSSASALGGNDTLTTLVLTVNQSTVGDTNATVCDNFTWHGTSYNGSGTYIWQTLNSLGCDSTVTLYLTINQSTSSAEAIMACDSWQGYSSDTVITIMTTAANGCDSTHTIALTVNHNATTSEAISACDIWQGYTADTILTSTATAVNGCDSTHTIVLTINHSVTISESITSCDEWQGYTNDTVLTITTIAANGCDSTYTITISINHSAQTLMSDTAEGSYVWHDSTYTESGTYQWQGQTKEGCDSIVTLVLEVTHVGIDVIGNNNIGVSVHPNPTSGWLTIEPDDVLLVDVYDPSGRKVASYKQTNHLFLGELQAGNYILIIYLPRGEAVQRVVVK